MISDAVLSDCGRYRYRLGRQWEGPLSPAVVFVMLNPSTADATVDDPTIRRCIGFAKTWGYGRLVVVNLFALRATDPRELAKADDAIGPENASWLERATTTRVPVIAAWGAHPFAAARGRMFARRPPSMLCLGKTKDGSPRHPLYVPAATKPVLYTA